MSDNKSLKCIVWDLDNTLWDGILAEGDNVILKESMAVIIRELDRRGIIQSVASKNDASTALKQLELIGLKKYFLYPQIGWGNKSASIKVIKEELNIGYDSIAFIDDQVFEIEEVNFVHPLVRGYSADIIPQILEMPEFKPRFITSESAMRRQMYTEDAKRKKDEEELTFSNQQFLEQLNLCFSISLATKDDLQRIEELTVRTSQLNATGYTYSYEELEALLLSPRHRLFVCELEDKYGSYGKIGVALLECDNTEWCIKLLLMSCRVISRGVGNVLIRYLAQIARQKHVKLYADFFHTDRNRIMYITYKFSGFEQYKSNENGGELLLLKEPQNIEIPSYIRFQGPEWQAENLDLR